MAENDDEQGGELDRDLGRIADEVLKGHTPIRSRDVNLLIRLGRRILS